MKGMKVNSKLRQEKPPWATMFRLFCDESIDGVYIIDKQGRFMDVNSTYCRLAGYSREELQNMSILEIEANDTPEKTRDHIKEVIDLGKSRFETAYKRRDGSIVEIEVSATFLDLNYESLLLGYARDITERKKSHEEIRENKSRFRDIVENVLDWIWELDAGGKFTYSSPIVKKFLGYEPEEILGKHFTDLLHPENVEEAKKAIFEVFTKKEPFKEFICRSVHKSDKIVWFSTSGVPVLDKKGKLLGYRGAATNITDLKRAEAKLREEKEFSDSLIASMHDGFVVLDSNAILIDVNPAFCEVTGFTRDELIGTRPPHPYWPPDNFEIEREFRKNLSGVFGNYDTTLMKKNGERFPVIISPSWVKNKHGDVISHFAIVQDITERKQIEEKLVEEKEFSDSLIVSMHDGFTVLDSNGVYIDVNPAFCKMTGFSREELIGVGPPHPYWPPENFDEIEKSLQMSFQGIFGTFDLTFMRKNGERFPVIVTSSCVRDKQGKIISHFAITKDITDRKLAEQTLIKHRDHLKEIVDERTRELERARARLLHQDRLLGNLSILVGEDEPLLSKGICTTIKDVNMELVAETDNGESLVELASQHNPDIIVMDFDLPGLTGEDLIRRLKEIAPHIGILVICRDLETRSNLTTAIEVGAGGFLPTSASAEHLIQAISNVHSGQAAFTLDIVQKVLHEIDPSSQKTPVCCPLNPRELEILKLATKGLANKAIASSLSVSERTVDSHFRSIFIKMDVSSRTEAIYKALKSGWPILS